MTEPSEEQRWLALSKALTSLDKYLSLYSPMEAVMKGQATGAVLAAPYLSASKCCGN